MSAPTTWLERAYADEFAFVWRTLRNLGCADARVEDLLQDVFLVLHQHGEVPASQLRGFLFLTARNVFRNGRRKDSHTVPSALTDSAEHPIAPDSPERALQSGEEFRLLQAWLSELSTDDRDAFILLELEELDADEAASILNTNRNTLYSRARRAREVLTHRWSRLMNEGKEFAHAIVR